jgi:uncharacterized metal-binding protein YceD (DUF177 family)
MGRDRAFERAYSLNIARLSIGNQELTFDVGQEFFEHFDRPVVRNGQVQIRLALVKTATHLDARFFVSGQVELECDRCLQPYFQPVEDTYRIIYAFKPGLKVEEEEVIYTSPDEQALPLVQEIYDFISLAVPMRRVPDPEVHTCAPEILALITSRTGTGEEELLEQDSEADEAEEETEDEFIFSRGEAEEEDDEDLWEDGDEEPEDLPEVFREAWRKRKGLSS